MNAHRSIYERAPATRLATGPLTPDFTRTVASSTGLLTSYGNGGAVTPLVLPYYMTEFREVKHYLGVQDHFRRPAHDSLKKEPGTLAQVFEGRIENRSFKSQPYGLRSRMTDDDIREADRGIDVRLQKQFWLASQLALDEEYEGVEFLTTQANYATGHFTTVTPWDAVGADPISNFRTAMGTILTDCGGLIDRSAVEFVLAIGYDGYATLESNPDLVDRWASISNNKSAVPERQWIAQALGISRIEVSEMAAGPTIETTTAPVKTDNVFVWPATTDKAALLLVDKRVDLNGAGQFGMFTAAGRFGRYERFESEYLGAPGERNAGLDVEWVQLETDRRIVPVAVDNTTSLKMIAAHLFEDLIT